MLIIIVNILLIFFIAGLIYRNLSPPLNWKWFSAALVLKLGSGLLLGALYFYYYEHGDTLIFHQKASSLADLARSDFDAFISAFLKSPTTGSFQGASRTWLMIQLTTLFHLATDNNYWLTSCWISLFSFAGFYYLCSKVVEIWPRQQLAITIAFLFFPSVVFWSSGVIKEAIALGAMGFMFGMAIKYLNDSRPYYLIIAFLFLFLIWQLKYYIAAVWVMVLIPSLILLKVAYKKRFWAIVIGIIVLLTGVTLTHPNFYPERIIDVIYSNYQAYHQMSQSNEAIRFPYEHPDLLFIIINAPVALFTALFMPLIFMSFKLPYITAVMENLLIFSLFIGWIFSRNKFSGLNFNVVLKGTLWIYIILLGIFLALSVPNFGTLSRFRISFLPFFIWLILADNYLLDRIKLNLAQYSIWIKNR
ncbi:MAG: hypothetical protein ACNS60_05525 [Candidatus Cyclobacteriaceae bacterium M2_1C_046]